MTGSTSLVLVEPCAAERRVDIERIGRHPVAHSSQLMVEKICRDNLEIVIGGVGEGAFAVAIAQRKNARHIGGELVIDTDEASFVDCNAGLAQAEIIRIRPTPNRQEHM